MQIYTVTIRQYNSVEQHRSFFQGNFKLPVQFLIYFWNLKEAMSISDKFRSRWSPGQNPKSTICIGGSCALYITRPCRREQSRYSSSMCPVILRSKSQSFERRALLKMYGGYHCLFCSFFIFLLSNSNEFGYSRLSYVEFTIRIWVLNCK